MGKSREKEGDEQRRAGEGDAERLDQKGATREAKMRGKNSGVAVRPRWSSNVESLIVQVEASLSILCSCVPNSQCNRELVLINRTSAKNNSTTHKYSTKGRTVRTRRSL